MRNHYFYKIIFKSKTFYVDCEWFNNVDFETLEESTPICNLIVNDLEHFWKGA
ncbi:hypothetical protein DFQ28_009306, partial [Apophysomyces sp. BC1034]